MAFWGQTKTMQNIAGRWAELVAGSSKSHCNVRTEISFWWKSVFGEVVFRAGFFIEHGPIPNGDAHEWTVPIPGYYGSSADHLAWVLLLTPSQYLALYFGTMSSALWN